MAKLNELINTKVNQDVISIQGVDIPVVFTFETFPLIEEAYGKGYEVFEKELNLTMATGQMTIGKKEVKLMNALIYGMVKSAGTDCTPHEIKNAIPPSDLPGIFRVTLGIFNRQNFQFDDMEKLKEEKK